MESQAYPATPSGNCCYFYHAATVVEVPLVSLDYTVSILNNLARIKLKQRYANPLDSSIESHFSFPIDTDFCFEGLRACFEGYTTQGTIMERSIAKKEYQAQVSQGNVAALATISKQEQSVMTCRVGNLPPGQTVDIEFEIACELRAESNGKYLLRLPSHIAPRYNRESCASLLELFYKLFAANLQQKNFLTAFKWTFTVDVQTTEKLTSYELAGEPHTTVVDGYHHVTFAVQYPVLPLHDITVLFSHDNFHKPQLVLSPTAAYISLAPDARSDAIEERQMQKFDGQFVFLLDRSGSMSGTKINQARQSLILFAKSLPDSAKFNVVSFGSNYQFMFEYTVSYNESNLAEAVQKIEKMGADMGGTEIGEPLKYIERRIGSAKNVNVFVITDGQVSNTEYIIRLCQSIHEEKGGRVHMVGVGSGISVDMIKRGAQYGGGECVFILNETAMKRQIMGLLMKVVMPRLAGVSIDYDNKVIAEIVSNIDGECINRGDHTHIIARFVEGVNKEQVEASSIVLKYSDEEDGKAYSYQIPFKSSVTFADDTVLKLFAWRLNQRLEQERAAPKWKDAIVENCLKYQVMSAYTAFLCKIKQVKASVDQGTLLKLKNFMEGSSTSQKAKSITVSVKTLTGKNIDVTLPNTAFIYDLKQAVEEMEGIPINQQRMIYSGKQLEDQRTLLDYGMDDGAVAHLVLRLRGDDGGRSSQPMASVSTYGARFGLKFDSTVEDVKQRVCGMFPVLRSNQLKVIFKEAELTDSTKKLSECGVNNENRELTVTGPKMFDSNFFVSSMKADGSWTLDKNFLQEAGMISQYERLLTLLKDENLAYTVVVYYYMRRSFPQEEKELRMLYRKVQRFVEEAAKKAGIEFDLAKEATSQ